RRGRTVALLGQPASRTAELLGAFRAALAVCPTGLVHFGCEFFSSFLAQTGVVSMNQRVLRVAFTAFLTLATVAARAQSGGELRFCLHTEPKTFNPVLAEDDASETVRYLTGGVLIRVDRLTQATGPELAISWKISNGGKTITFKLREGIHFSDGSPFSADDVAYTMQLLMDPSVHSPTGDSFRSDEGKVETRVPAPNRIAITFPAPIAGL